MTGNVGCGHTTFTTCPSARSFTTTSHVRRSHANIRPQSLPVATTSSPHANATDLRNVFSFLCPTYRRTLRTPP